jgi:anti-anti-sigma factor
MTIGERSIGDVTIVDVGGRITVQEGVDQFRDVARELIRQGHVKIVLNLQHVPYIDSTALGEIIRTYTSVIRKGGSVKLLNVSTHVHQLFVITRLLTVFDLFDAESEAVKSFGRPR